MTRPTSAVDCAPDGTLLRRRQRGAATLIVVLILFFVVSLVAAYTNRNLIFEQRTANNQYRSTQALEAAEAGLEWAIGVLNLGRVDNSCVASTNTSDLPFRKRYLSTDSTGRIVPVLDPASTSTPAEPLSAACVFTGSAWQCSCPSSGQPSLTAPTGAGIYPAFRVRFQQILGTSITPGVPRQPAVVRVQVVGCTRADVSGSDQCLQFTGGLGAAGEGRAVVSSLISLTGTASSPPQAALVAKGSVNANISAYNTYVGGSGITIQAGGAITGVGNLASLPGSPGGTSTAVASDATLALASLTGANAISSADRMFAAVFNHRPAIFQEQPAAVKWPCSGGVCSGSDVQTNVAAVQPWRPIWLSDGLDVDTDVGSAAEPVLLIVNGNLTFSSSSAKVYGVVYIRTSPTATPASTWSTSGAGQVVGAVVTDGSVAGTGTTSMVFDPTVVSLVRWNTGSFVRVPASWKDFE